MNSINLVGRLVDEPVGRNNNEIAKFRLAVDRGRTDKTTGEKLTDFFNVSVFGQAAKHVLTYKHKGELVSVTGQHVNNQYQDKEGHNRDGWVVETREVGFLGAGKNANAQGDAQSAAQGAKGAMRTPAQSASQDDDEIPF